MSDAESQATSDDDLSPKEALGAEPAPDSSAFDRRMSQERLALVKGTYGYWIGLFPKPQGYSPRHADGFEQRKSRFIDKALNALRERVFNTMPIRLLCFQKPAHSKLQITLIEHGEIYAHVESKLVKVIGSLRESGGGEDEKDLRELILDSWSPSEDAAQTDHLNTMLDWFISPFCRYTILSHTWLRGEYREVTYGDWNRREFDPEQPGYRKLVNFCRTVWKDYGVAFGWMDTVCINKESSTELDESIRSMYKWYKNASVCITYLADTMSLSDMPQDTWFTRGWTLQELFAPSQIKFYNTNWVKLVESLKSDKDNSITTDKIEEATTITARELKQDMFNIPISRRMQMAAKRQVTRGEDSAYSLMGIFDVSIATAYGEGAERAFSRLLQAVLNSTSKGIADVFNWAGPNHSQVSALLPSSLQHYLERSSDLGQQHIKAKKPIKPIMLTHLGLCITILLMPSISFENENATQSPWRDYHAIADVSLYPTDVTGSYSVLDAGTKRISNKNTWNSKKQLALGVLNIEGVGNEFIQVPRLCLAVALSSIFGNIEKLATKAPVTFTLNKGHGPDTSLVDGYYIPRKKLESHGMKLATLIL
jgi:hypothetical protein